MPRKINSFFVKNSSIRGKLPIGITWIEFKGKYQAQCNSDQNKKKNLRYYETQEEAFLAYKNYKENLAKKIAERYKNIIPQKVFNALMNYTVDIND